MLPVHPLTTKLRTGHLLARPIQIPLYPSNLSISLSPSYLVLLHTPLLDSSPTLSTLCTHTIPLIPRNTWSDTHHHPVPSLSNAPNSHRNYRGCCCDQWTTAISRWKSNFCVVSPHFENAFLVICQNSSSIHVFQSHLDRARKIS